MKILVTNDDGIDSEGLDILVTYLKAAKDTLGNPHDITVIAPDIERSGVSHAMTLKHPTKVRKLTEGIYSCSGTPADCVIVAGLGIMKDAPDLVVSGINRGPNLGTDIIYSGTCGAARQAAISAVPAIAVSCAHMQPPLDYRACAAFVAKNLEALVKTWVKGSFININGPSSSDETLQARWCIPGENRYHDTLKCFEGADGYTYCFLTDGRHERSTGVHTDHSIVSKGNVAISLVTVQPCSMHPDVWNGTLFA
jgi:5'-nucleotidase